MELLFNTDAAFTRWIVRSGTLREAFVVVDVGVQGGVNERWHLLGDHLVVHGFDAVEEVIGALSQGDARTPSIAYHALAIGNEDGDREFFVRRDDSTSSSFYRSSDPRLEPRTVPIRKLDTLLRTGVIPKADFLKVDVEGFESDVFHGAAELLAAGVLGVEFETNLMTSVTYPSTHFVAIQDILLQHGMFVCDLNFNRVLRSSYQEARARRKLPPLPSAGAAGKPSSFNVLFCRDIAAERGGDAYYAKVPPRPSVDQILKTMSIFELYGLSDMALDTAVACADELGQRLDVERAVDLLCRQHSVRQSEDVDRINKLGQQINDLKDQRAQLYGKCLALEEALSQMQSSTAWRLTAPLRTVVHRFRNPAR